MKRLLTMTGAIVASLAVGSLAASAGPIFYNGGPTPDPKAVSRCAGEQGGVTFVNGGPLPATPSPSVDGSRDTAKPVMINGGPTPVPVPPAAAEDPTWCGGAYRPDAGTNFGGGN